MNTKSQTPRLHPFLCACAVSLCLGMAIIAGPAFALDTTTSGYGGVNVFRFTLYEVGDPPPEGVVDDIEASVWNLTTDMKNDIRRTGDLWAEILGPGSALTTTPGNPLASGIPFMVTTSHDEDNASAFILLNANDTMTGVQRGLIDAITPDKPGAINIGLLYRVHTGLDLTPLPHNGDLGVLIFHELGHALGITSFAKWSDEQGKTGVLSPWDRHLYDKYGTRLDVGVTPTAEDPGQAGSGLFYVGERTNSGVTFRGDHVAEVLSDGRVKTASADYAFTVQGREESVFDLSHIELERSLMSHQNYRNYSTFMEAELAALQDIGYRIDRRNFYGFSVYSDNSVFTYSDGYHGRDYDPASDTGRWTSDPNTATLGVGLHIYGKGNTVTVSQNEAGTGDVLAHGEAGTGVRVDGSGNTLIIGSDAGSLIVSADGKNGTGLLAAYGKDHVITIGSDAAVTARGEGGIGALFDFGHNLLGDQDEYRGSHIRWAIDEKGDKTQAATTGKAMSLS